VSLKWSQLKCVSSISVFLLLQTPIAFGSVKSLPKLLQEVEKKYSKSGTITAEFSQLNENSTFSQKKASTGKIYVKLPSKIRWETEKPEPNLLVSNGKIYWFYTPPFDPTEPGQVIEKPTSQIESKLVNALLSGSFSTAQIQSIFMKNATTFDLTPKPGTAATVSKATLEIDGVTKEIKKVTLNHKGGNRSEITLSKIELGKPLSDDFFVFHAPPNTEKLQEGK
jgi:outer membrane lipoprotein carrier protein